MNTETTQNAKQGENKDNKKSMAAKVATGVAATAAAAGIGGVVASMVGSDSEGEAQPEQEAQSPAENATTSQAEQEFNQMMANGEPAAQGQPQAQPVAPAQPAPQAASAAAAAAAPIPQPHAAQPHMAQPHVAQPATAHTEQVYSDIPVDESWITTPSSQEHAANDNPIPAHEQQAVAAVTHADELGYDPNDVLINTVNVSPEVLMAMLHLKPTHMIQTEFRGDGLGHTAALLAGEDGENYMLIDTDGDGLLDKLTDMDGNSYASLDENTQFVVDANAMNNFIDTTNPADDNNEPMYAQIDEAEIVNIEGEGEGEEMAFIDDNDINADDIIVDEPQAADEDAAFIDDVNEEIAYENENPVEEDLAMSNEPEIDTDLISYDDSSLA